MIILWIVLNIRKANENHPFVPPWRARGGVQFFTTEFTERKQEKTIS
jgi:hypothetical protein